MDWWDLNGQVIKTFSCKLRSLDFSQRAMKYHQGVLSTGMRWSNFQVKKKNDFGCYVKNALERRYMTSQEDQLGENVNNPRKRNNGLITVGRMEKKGQI